MTGSLAKQNLFDGLHKNSHVKKRTAQGGNMHLFAFCSFACKKSSACVIHCVKNAAQDTLHSCVSFTLLLVR